MLLEDEIAYVEKCYLHNPSEELLVTLNEKHSKLEKLYETKAKGVIIRSRARWTELGEKNTKYFFNLEKKNY